ncbi:hypothetical protein HGB24_01790 [Candidatus Saccharibacteria bacterium]|nr:hypothetical protein [Candidatus Saccharibacteria bacterium]
MSFLANILYKKQTNHLNKKDWLYLLPAGAIFTIISLITITKSSIWFDEAFGAYLIRFNFFDIAKYTASDVHPPLYYWLLKVWSMAFGSSELSLRSMSLLFGLLAVFFAYMLIKRLFGLKSARFSLVFIIISPMLIRYSQEARMYMLVAAIAMAATYVLSIAMESKRRWPWIVYGLLVSLGMWTHYYSALVWLAHWIWRADVIRRSTKKRQFVKAFFSRDWIQAHLIAVGIYLPWLPFLVSQAFVVQAYGFWIPPVSLVTPFNYINKVFYYQDMKDPTGWLLLAILLLMSAVIYMMARRVYENMDSKLRQNYRLIMALSFAPILILMLVSLPPLRSTFVDRYLITSVFGISLFIGVTIAHRIKNLGSKLTILASMAIIAMMIFGISNVYEYGNYDKDSKQTRQIVEQVWHHAKPGQPIIAATPWLFYEVVFYSTDSHPVYYIAPDNYPYGSLMMLKENDMFKIKDVKKFEQDHPTFWYIGWSQDGKLDSPQSNWRILEKITIDDPINGGPEYVAEEFKVSD